MEKVTVNGRIFQTEKGTVLADVLREAGGLKMPCAGKGICGKCRVRASGLLSEPDETEIKKLTRAERENGIRLACRTRVLGECEVSFEEEATRQTPEEALLGLQPVRPLFEGLGAAVDIGTTTLAAVLFDKNGFRARAGADNPQSVFGADVISRMEKSMAGEREALALCIKSGLTSLLEELANKGGCSPADIDTLVLTGNTAMLYFFTGRDPSALSHAPFAADWLAGEWLTAEQLGLPGIQARAWLPPCVSAFVGADITTAMLSVRTEKPGNDRLLVDIGTNGEIVLWRQEGIFCCSTAAGPAFEGAGLKMGMQGTDGAVAHVRVAENGLAAEVIGDKEPMGICGSGVIDAVSCLLQTEDLDETGYLEDEEAVIAGEVRLFQEDIRKVQLAKSAICAGIKTMLHRAGMQPSELQELLVAGGFGSFIHLENAIAIGLLPEVELGKITVTGNAALMGAAMLLLDKEKLPEAERLAAVAQTVDLASDAFFKECYMEGMLF